MTIARATFAVLAAVAGFAAVTCGGGSPRPPSPIPTTVDETASAGPSALATGTATTMPPPTPTPDPLPSVLRGVTIRPLTLAESEGQGQGILFYYRGVRYQSHGNPDTLYRTYFDARGVEHTTDLFQPFRTGGQGGVYTWAADEGMGEIVAAVCEGGFCGLGILDPRPGEVQRIACLGCQDKPVPPADFSVFHSLDGGITWSPAGRLATGRSFAGWRGGMPLIMVAKFRPAGGADFSYESWPGGEPVAPPHEGLEPRSPDHGTLWWATPTDYTDLYDDAGERLYVALPIFGGFQYFAGDFGGSPFVTWFPSGESEPLLLRTTTSGKAEAGWSFGSLRIPAPPLVTAIDLLFATIDHPSLGYQVALVDPIRGEITPLPSLAEAVRNGGRGNGPALVRARRADVVEVEGTGSCLNLRTEPAASAPVRACYADGVLLDPGGRGGVSPGWLPVSGPGGLTGWVSTDFVND